MPHCPHCSTPWPTRPAAFCPGCGKQTGPAVPPVHLEKQGSLLNPFFVASVALTVAGGLLAGGGHFGAGGVLLAVGVPAILISTVRSLGH